MKFEEMKNLPFEEQRAIYKRLKSIRKPYKVVNYSSLYGVKEFKLSRETGMTVKEAKELLDAFWKRNWSIQEVVKNTKVRHIEGSMWLYNPVSRFWYSLRHEKDTFSTLNQSTGVFCFDTWVAVCRRNGIKVIGQFHDEIIALVKCGEEGETKAIMEDAIQIANDKLKLNVPLGIDAQFGKTYAEIH